MTSPYPATYPNGLYGDVMLGVRTWLRAHPYLTALKDANSNSLLGGRVFFHIPDKPTFPLVRLYRVGGTNQPGDAPIEDAQVGIDVWGGSYEDVTNIANAIKAACHLMNTGTLLGATTVGLNADVLGEIDSPDPDSSQPRKALTALFTVRVVTASG